MGYNIKGPLFQGRSAQIASYSHGSILFELFWADGGVPDNTRRICTTLEHGLQALETIFLAKLAISISASRPQFLHRLLTPLQQEKVYLAGVERMGALSQRVYIFAG